MYSGRNVLKGYRINIGTPYQIEVKPKEEAAAKTEEDTAAAEEKPLVDEILQNARMEAEKIVNNAKIKAEEILNSANEKVAAIVSEAEEKARQEGYKQGEALARQHYQRLIDEAEEIKRKAKEIHDSTILGMESEIVELIIQITKKIIGTELSQNRDVIVGLIRNAVSAASLADTVLIHVSDEDYDYVVENKDRLFEGIKGVENFEIIKDNSLKKGECFVDTGMGIVDSSIETQIDAAESTLRDLLGGTDEKKNNSYKRRKLISSEDTMEVQVNLEKYKKVLTDKRFVSFKGQVTKVVGLTIESKGPESRVGELCRIVNPRTKLEVLAEVVGFRDNHVLLMPLGEMTGIGPGSEVIATGTELKVRVGHGLLGRVLDGLGNPIDGKGNIPAEGFYPVDNIPPHPLTRPRIKEVLPLGVKCIDSMLTLGKGQRMGIFAGSGVGKSTLIGMIARNTKADIIVIGLIGERGREVRDFLERDLTEEGLKRSVVVVATSDQPALIRKKGAMVATAIAEYFRDCGYDVLLLMDSLTRFSMAQREIGLAIGEPPVSRGYTPSVFSVMPKLLERSGTSDKGSITGLYTVLVDGDDMTEPVTDTARSILDGHVVLSRQLAHKNHYPAIDVLGSISRVMSDIVTDEHKKIAGEIRKNLAVYREAEDLINVGAYVKGSNPEIDRAISVIGNINAFLTQSVNEKFDFEETLELMKKALEVNG